MTAEPPPEVRMCAMETEGEAERRARRAASRETVTQGKIYRWAGNMVRELGSIAACRMLESAG